MSGTLDRPDAATFQAALPSGWTVAIYHRTGDTSRGYVVRASHQLYGEATIGPKLRLVPLDVEMLRERVRDVEAPPLTYSQWLASGKRQAFVQPPEPDERVTDYWLECSREEWQRAKTLAQSLRLLATCIERGDVEPSDVAQALFNRDVYNVNCPVAVASNYGRAVAEFRWHVREREPPHASDVQAYATRLAPRTCDVQASVRRGVHVRDAGEVASAIG